MAPIAHVPIAHCQVVKKMSSLSKICQMSKNQTPGLWRRFTKKINWHNEVHRYWCQFWRHIWWSLKTLKMFTESIFGQFWWPSYLMSKLTSISVNLMMSIYFFLWTSSIVCIFDFFIFDIFLTTWHLFDILTHQLNLNHLSPLYHFAPVGLIAHVPHIPCTPLPPVSTLPIGPIAHVAHTPCTPLPHYPYGPLPNGGRGDRHLGQ